MTTFYIFFSILAGTLVVLIYGIATGFFSAATFEQES